MGKEGTWMGSPTCEPGADKSRAWTMSVPMQIRSKFDLKIDRNGYLADRLSIWGVAYAVISVQLKKKETWTKLGVTLELPLRCYFMSVIMHIRIFDG